MSLKTIAASLALLLTSSAMGASYAPPANGHDSMAPSAINLQDKLDRNGNPYYAEPDDWFKRITISGLLQVGAMYSGRDTSTAAGGLFPAAPVNSSDLERFPLSPRNSSDIWLSRAGIYFDADVNEWTSVHIVASTYNGTPNGGGVGGSLSQVYGINDEASYRKYAALDEGYATFGNLAEWPVYLRTGIEYIPFGHYIRHVLTMTLPQYLSQTQAPVIQLGVCDINGFSGAVYIFRSTTKINNGTHVNNGGFTLEYNWRDGDDVSIDVMFDYLRDIVGAVNYFQSPFGLALAVPIFRTVGGIATTGKLQFNGFDMTIQFVGTTRRMHVLDATWGAVGHGPRLYAWLVDLGWSFDFMDHDARIGGSYQRTHNALALALPRHRLQGDFDLNLMKNVDFGLHVVWDKNYGLASSGTLRGVLVTGNNRSTLTGLASISVKFA